ncbi:V-set and immunoglobulin domain-containing protein 10-like isoform X3 [Brienomyrus brachyistius]|nr:V-set and immunoglobulin domain-containing protein 10-like isoform X2 [Brienomyrus brachyistius]XP_048882776.1 V-set and immunoglobulin domain-containing protein 10-like isoform X3 [Brienomyrus brachyistius]XP_048882777.1 V-set and immunoglobulin domain-containing protein 10-like isoform X3 [Brienomyrus brachyistius]
MTFKTAMPVDRGRSLRRVFWASFIAFLVADSADCALSLTVQSPPTVIAKAGSNVILNVSFAGAQNPLIEWYVDALTIVTWSSPSPPEIAPNYLGVVSLMPNGSLVFSNVQKNYSATYTVSITKSGVIKATGKITLQVFAQPVCLIQSANTNLNYTCQTPGDAISMLSFPDLNQTLTMSGSLSLVVPASKNLNGSPIFCVAKQINITQSCSVTAEAPQGVASTVSSTVSNGNLVVTITCAIGSVPAASITWSKGSQVLSNGGQYQISSDTTQLNITSFNLTTSDLSTYTCNGSNPLGSQKNSIPLIGPTISNSSLISNAAGTMVTLTWNAPLTSVFTGFNIQMEGPALQPSNGTNQTTGGLQTIAVMPSSARSKQISGLNPKSNYWFWIVPLAGSVIGPPSQNYSVGPECNSSLSVYSPPTVIAKAGSNVTLNVLITGAQNPVIEWSVGALPIVTWTSPKPPAIAPNYMGVVSLMANGSLVFSNVPQNYSATYTLNITKIGFCPKAINITLRVFAGPVCSVQSAKADLQYTCQTPGDNGSLLSFPYLSDTTKIGSLSLVVSATQDLNGKEISCVAFQMNMTQSCSVTAQAPQGFLPTVSSTVSNGNLVVTITCALGSVPAASTTWFKGSQVLSNGGPYQISSDTTQLNITGLNLIASDLSTYTCNGSNPFGSQKTSIQLTGPTISESSIIPNAAGTMVTLTWNVPRTSVFTGFSIQMEGPALQPSNGMNRRRKRDTGGLQTIAVMPSSARSTQISGLDPKSNYWFWIVPLAGSVIGAPSQNYSVGPVQGLSKAAILGLAIGIPCGFLLLIIIIALIILCVVCCRRRRRRHTYPPPRASQKVVTGQANPNTPHNLVTRGIQNGSPVKNTKGNPERHLPLPSTETLSPMRTATTV